MKAISGKFGFWVLILCGFGMSFSDEPVGAAICMVGAVLFNAIKTMSKEDD